MKKDKASKKSNMKPWVVKQLKSLIGPLIILIIIIAGVLVISFYKEEAEPVEMIKVDRYDGEQENIVLENDKLILTMDSSTTQFTMTCKESGKVWYSNPPKAEEDELALKLEKEMLRSTLLLTYSTKNGVDTQFNNFAYSIENGIYDIEQGEDFIKVSYSIGNVEKEYMIPEIIKETRMNEILGKLDKKVGNRVKDSYKKYDINKLGRKDNKEELIELYPQLETEVLYIFRSGAKESLKAKIEEGLAAGGYTYEEYLADKGDKQSETDADKPMFNISVIYRLEGDDLVVEVPLKEVKYREQYPICYLNVLPYFGAGSLEDEGYMMVPEGGGSLIHFNNGKTSQSSYYANMYGWDMAQDREAVVHETETYFNAYGIANNDSSFLCILEEGAPYAAVQADISGKKNSYNSASVVYTLVHRDNYEVTDRYNGKMYVYEDALPDENLIQRYRFLNSNNYVDMAMTYRDYMLEEYKTILTEKKDVETPIVVELVGAVDKVKQIAGVPVLKPLKLTTFDEAKTILQELKESGLKNMSTKMIGWMNGGVQQEILNNIELVSDLGSKNQLQALINYAKENNINFYLDGITNYAYNSDMWDGFSVFSDVARFVNKEKAELYPYHTITYGKIDYMEPYYLLRGTLIPDMIDNLVEEAADYEANVSFQDIGRELSADYMKKKPVSRQSALETQKQLLKEIKDSGMKIMINMGNNYAIAYSDMVTNMDLNGSVYSIIDETVPIYQMALHGYVNYTGEPINLTQNCEEELLKSVEYGAGLSATFMYETTFALQNTMYTDYFGADYQAWKERLIEIYSRHNEELGYTFGLKMVNHKNITDTLSCTEYEDGTKVYVNYSYDEVATPESIKIPARDYYVQKGY